MAISVGLASECTARGDRRGPAAPREKASQAMRLPNGETRFVQSGIESRLIRINERSAAGDPLEEFPKGNSLWRLEGAFVFPCWLHEPDPYLQQTLGAFRGRRVRLPWRAFDHLNSSLLFSADAQIQFASGVHRCASGRHVSAIGRPRILCVRNV